MKALADLQQKRFLFKRLQGRLRIAAPQIVDLGKRLDDAFDFPHSGIMVRR